MISKPQPGEYSPYAENYISLAAAHDNIIKLLEDLLESNSTFYMLLPPEKAAYAYAPDKWTIKQVLGHIIDTERIFAFRALCVARGEKGNLPGFEQDDYEANSTSNDRELADLVVEYVALRVSNLHFLKSLNTEQANRIGLTNGNPVSVRALAHMIAGHELHHLNIIRERYL